MYKTHKKDKFRNCGNSRVLFSAPPKNVVFITLSRKIILMSLQGTSQFFQDFFTLPKTVFVLCKNYLKVTGLIEKKKWRAYTKRKLDNPLMQEKPASPCWRRSRSQHRGISRGGPLSVMRASRSTASFSAARNMYIFLLGGEKRNTWAKHARQPL